MKKALTWIGIGLGGVLVLLILAAGVLYTIGGSKLNATVDVPAENLVVTMDSATVAKGQHIALTHGCTDCHGANLAGQVFADAPPFLIVASNLTRGQGGIGSKYHDADWEHAIRHGIRPNGHGLAPMMPAKAYNNLSDDETAALIAYLKSLPPVDNVLPATKVRPLGRIIAATGGLPLANTKIDQAKPHKASAPPYGPTVEYGTYLGAICGYCHGADLHGGPPLEPDAPAPPDLYAVNGWSLDDFVKALRTGVTPSGKELNPQQMPWMAFRNMTDVELEALYKYLSTLTPAGSQTADSGTSD